jgi:hypothetical protein
MEIIAANFELEPNPLDALTAVDRGIGKRHVPARPILDRAGEDLSIREV